MKTWSLVWELLRDVGFTCFGAWIIYQQEAGASLGRSVSTPLLFLGGVIMVPAARAHFIPLLLHAIGQSSSSSPSSGEPPSGSSSGEGGTDD